MKLLIADDSNIIRSKIARCLSGNKLEIVGLARNGREAFELAMQHRPDVITMDITMPEMDGIECIQRIHAQLPSAMILVVSALADKATAIQAIKEGAHGFLCKPFSEQDLNEAIEELLGGLARG